MCEKEKKSWMMREKNRTWDKRESKMSESEKKQEWMYRNLLYRI